MNFLITTDCSVPLKQPTSFWVSRPRKKFTTTGNRKNHPCHEAFHRSDSKMPFELHLSAIQPGERRSLTQKNASFHGSQAVSPASRNFTHFVGVLDYYTRLIDSIISKERPLSYPESNSPPLRTRNSDSAFWPLSNLYFWFPHSLLPTGLRSTSPSLSLSPLPSPTIQNISPHHHFCST